MNSASEEISVLQGELARSQARERLLQRVLDHMPVMIAYWDRNETNRFANRAYEDWLGMSPAQIEGMYLKEVIGDTLYPLNRPYVEGVLSGKTQTFERQVTNPETSHSREAQAHYIPDVTDGGVQGFFVLVNDVSELKRSEERYRTVVTDQTELISRLKADGTYLFANDVFCRFFGKTPVELMGSTWEPLVHPDDKPRVMQQLAQLNSEQPVVMIENRVLSADGTVHWMEFSNRGFFDDDGRLEQIQSVGRDITQRKIAEAQLLQLNAQLTVSHQQLRDMSAQNESRIEAERKHFSREVHDELGQILTALRMDTLVMEMKFSNLGAELNDKVQDMKALVDRAIEAVRDVAANLRPLAMDMGLTDALKWLCAEFTRTSGVPCKYIPEKSLATIDANRAIVLFRIVQESLTNVTRHANASQVQVVVQGKGTQLQVSIQDNGIGLDINGAITGKTLGLLGMRERAMAIDGTVQFSGGVGAGTTVVVSIPLSITGNRGTA
jgi:PAS domain S-box-containing protein